MKNIFFTAKRFVIFTMLSITLQVVADDTEIFTGALGSSNSGRPKVLIVFDDSGSMGTWVSAQRPEYDPNGNYDEKFPAGRIYWSKNSYTPSRFSEQYIDSTQNRCDSSFQSLNKVGFFDTKARRWIDSKIISGDCSWQCPSSLKLRYGRPPGEYRWSWGCYSCYRDWWCFTSDFVHDANRNCTGSTVQVGEWARLDSLVHTPPHFDCKADVDSGNDGNGSAISNGFPQKNAKNNSAYGAHIDDSFDWGDEAYRFYTSHYLNWLNDSSIIVPRTRLSIAQEVVTSLISANTGVDFGFLEFNGNRNSSTHGGRIIQRIPENMSKNDRSLLVKKIRDQIDASGGTPICEATYEALRYLKGESIYYGSKKSNYISYWGNHDDELTRDPLAENPPGIYSSPTADCAYTYIIIMTDGKPFWDTSANSQIKTLTGEQCSYYATDDWYRYSENCLPQLAKYMANTDLDGNPKNGNQYAITYTIGFTTDQQLLEDTAEAGGGLYFTADSAVDLAEAFQGAIINILATDTTFTSPAVAIDTFSNTQSRDEVFYAMFRPGERVNWSGNIKKLKLKTDINGTRLVDKNGAPALDPGTGAIKDSAQTYWSLTPDGSEVGEGGIGGVLARRNPASRNIFFNTADTTLLTKLKDCDIPVSSFGVDDKDEIYGAFNSVNEEACNKQVNWARGFDSYDQDGDGDTTDSRSWILGDILHSRPLVVNYGARASHSNSNPDIRILAGTNAGFFHMFENETGDESWAFLPRELVPILSERRKNRVSSEKIYGVDGSASIYTLDKSNDGTIDPSKGDKVWVFFGLRRGGSSYYGLDISDPDNPKLLWSINPSTTGFAELGQTWSPPVVSAVPGYNQADGSARPVLIFGAGYDPNKDDHGLATPDVNGRGIFIVDAETGSLIWGVTPSKNESTNILSGAIQHSVPGRVTVLDSDGDSRTDRIYFGDTGGNLWRVDLAGITLPKIGEDSWQLTKLAVFNQTTPASDRRFFNAPDVVRIRFGGKPVDAILIGSGDRTNPNGKDVINRFYMIRDEAVTILCPKSGSVSGCSNTEDTNTFLGKLPLTDANFLDVTALKKSPTTQEDFLSNQEALKSKSGWFYEFTHLGEKNLDSSITLAGKVYVPSFTPFDNLDGQYSCAPEPGKGAMYIFDLYEGSFGKTSLGNLIPQAPSIHVGTDGNIRMLLPPGSNSNSNSTTDENGNFRNQSSICANGICNTSQSIPLPYGYYWFEENY